MSTRCLRESINIVASPVRRRKHSLSVCLGEAVQAAGVGLAVPEVRLIAESASQIGFVEGEAAGHCWPRRLVKVEVRGSHRGDASSAFGFPVRSVIEVLIGPQRVAGQCTGAKQRAGVTAAAQSGQKLRRKRPILPLGGL